jgi:hypothetical protein
VEPHGGEEDRRAGEGRDLLTSAATAAKRRLSRAGNQCINRVLHIMAIVQLRNDTEGRGCYPASSSVSAPLLGSAAVVRESAREMPAAVEARIVGLRRAHPSWGPSRIRWQLEQQGVEPLPGRSSVYRALVRHGLVEVRKRKRRRVDYAAGARPVDGGVQHRPPASVLRRAAAD